MSMRVVFMGTPEFAIESLRRILGAGHTVPLVVTVPDRFRGRGLRLHPSDVKKFALSHSLDVATPASLGDEAFLGRVRAAEPDVLCVVAFRILPEALFSIPPKGSINLHGSLLPRYRGAAPINRAIMAGESATGLTTFFLRSKVDTGSVILQRELLIGPDMTAGELHDVMKVVGADLVLETLDLIEQGRAETRPQDNSLATSAPKIFPGDCVIDWRRSTAELHNHVRGLSPWPGAFTTLGGKRLKIMRTRRENPGRTASVGVVTRENERLFVGTGDGAIEIMELQMEGSRPMEVATFLRGHTIQTGTELGVT